MQASVQVCFCAIASIYNVVKVTLRKISKLNSFK